MPIGMMYVMRRGLAVRMWNFITNGKVWGEDALMPSLTFLDHAQAVALTFVETLALDRVAFLDVMRDFPRQNAIINKRIRQIPLRRALTYYLLKATNGRTVRSFVSRADAAGYTYAPGLRAEMDALDMAQGRGDYMAGSASTLFS